jgi:hypothetical protein
MTGGGPYLLFLHGINAAGKRDWLVALNEAIALLGFEPFEDEKVITPYYRQALQGEVALARPPATTWKKLPDKDLEEARTDYVVTAAALERRIRAYQDGWDVPVLPPAPPFVPKLLGPLDEARRYIRDEPTRNAVWNTVLQSLSIVQRGPQLVILAHSLGSVVARDILKRLPPHLTVKVLVTIGSPLASVPAFQKVGPRGFAFPYGRLGAWVNIYEPRDLVTGARELSRVYPEVLDVPVTLPDLLVPALLGQHGAKYYCTHKAVAAAITGALYGRALEPVQPLGSLGVAGLELPLLQCLYQRESAKQLPASDLERVQRFNRARRLTAQGHVEISERLHAQDPEMPLLGSSAFLAKPDSLIRGAWDDRTVLALAIMLSSGPPAPPFRVEEDAKTEIRRNALLGTLNLIRRPGSSVTDLDLVDAVYAAIEESEECLGARDSWLPMALIGAGVVALAATGVGLWAAAPAGLAGAALVTSTLAAFGPGGMIGGMATLAALTGASTAAAAAGAALEVGGEPDQEVNLLGFAIDQALASGNPASLRALLMSLISLVGAQERLRWPTQRDFALQSCLAAHASAARTASAHEAVDGRSKAAEASRELRDLLWKACAWLRGEAKQSAPEAADLARRTSAYRRALEGSGTPGYDMLVLPPRPLRATEARLELPSGEGR